MDTQNSTIAILDSGVGGLSIFASIRQALPYTSIVYGCDNKNFPYGPKPSETVTQCIGTLATKINSRFNPSLIVIACNTASTVALEYLRNQIPVPIVGVVPAIKPAASKSKTGTIGLLATPGTVQRPYTDKLIEEHASNCRVIKVGSTKLVELAEEKLRGKKISLDEIKKELNPFFSEGSQSPVDTIVLGCTHFPLLLNELQQAAPHPIQWLDSSEAIANRVLSLLSNTSTSAPKYQAVFTSLTPDTKELVPALHRLGFNKPSEI